MAGTSPTELKDLISALRTELEVLRAEFVLVREDIQRPEFMRIRERIATIEALLTAIDAPNLTRKIATLEEHVAELKKWREETERRKWQFLLGVVVCALTFTANLVMNFVLYFSRKPG
jgi:hypothetical protein